MLALPALLGICSLAVDFGYVCYDSFQLQQIADACAHDNIVNYAVYGTTAKAQSHTSTTKNKIFTMNGVTPAVTITWGYWDSYNQVFSTTAGTGTTIAVQVTATCTKANSNPVALMFASIIGQQSLDISASAVATDIYSSSTTPVPSTSNPYLAGMPSTTVTSFGDTVSANGATQASIPVVPGSWISFSSITGTTSVTYPSMPYYGPGGSTGSNGTAIQHGENWDGTMMGVTTENGIANAIMPDSAFMGVFLDNNEPDSEPTPSAIVDWTQSANSNQNSYSDLSLKSPFLIGNGLNGSTVKTFQVPPGATRLFLGVWDGVQYDNNSGSLTGTVTVQHQVMIVQ
jgi:hypothetical protein